MTTFFDAHMHIIDPRFPLIENQGYLPDPFTVADYCQRTAHFQVVGGAVVSGSFQGFDQTYLIDALSQLGPNFVGVTQIPHTTTDEEILRLNRHGVRAVRFNVRRGGSEDISRLAAMAARVYDLVKWHVELYIDSKDLPELAPTIQRLPAVSIDHLGLTPDGFDTLLDLVDKGVRVKGTGFGRVELDVAQAVQAITAVNPRALMFGTDLPSTRARRPFADTDLDLLADALGDADLLAAVLYGNALDWYRLQGNDGKAPSST